MNRKLNLADWQELERLSGKRQNEEDEKWYKIYLGLTEKEDEHPDWFEGNCFCKLCMSYADE